MDLIRIYEIKSLVLLYSCLASIGSDDERNKNNYSQSHPE